MRTPLNIGDRVRVYSFAAEEAATIETITGECLGLRLDNGSRYSAHVKQCRKLKPKKERREFWVLEFELHHSKKKTLAVRYTKDEIYEASKKHEGETSVYRVREVRG